MGPSGTAESRNPQRRAPEAISVKQNNRSDSRWSARAYSAAVLHYEMRGFERFKNRCQVGSITGLCPGIHLSDGRGKEGSINRCGIGIVRWTLVEMVWRLMIWQPQYPPVRRLAAGLVKSKRARKRLVVQAARRLAIDLWRLSIGQTTPEKLGLIMHSTK
jgi:hypothetical protein